LKFEKLLIITYYWPPAGGPGVQRWLKFAKYLPDFEIQPIVYVPKNASYPIIDENLVDEVPKNCIVLKKNIFEPYQLASILSKNKTQKISSGLIPSQKKQSFLEKLLLWIRGNLFIPDARKFWIKPSVKYLKKYIQDNNIETIVTSGPPHSLHLIGLQLKKEVGVKWLADFRDPWTTIGYHKALKLSSIAKNKHKKLENTVLNAADSIIVTSKTTKLEFQKITSKPITIITNGYDVETNLKFDLDKKFSIAHIGTLLSDRNPLILWEVLQELTTENALFSSYFELKLIGKISPNILETIAKYNLTNYLNNLGYVSHKKAIEEQKKSQLLLLIEIDSTETKEIIPGKLFEYIVSGRPIIAIGPKNSDFEEIIVKTNTGTFFDYQEKERLKNQIIHYFELFLDKKLFLNPVGLQEYSRKNLTKKLAELIHSNI